MATIPIKKPEEAPMTASDLQQQKLFRIYNHYRLVVSLLLL